jgi:hypothetical protein
MRCCSQLCVAAVLGIVLVCGAMAGGRNACPVPPIDALANVLRHASNPHTERVEVSREGSAGMVWTGPSLLGEPMPVLAIEGLGAGGFGAALVVTADDSDGQAPSDASESAVILQCAALHQVGASCALAAWDRSQGDLHAVAAGIADGQHHSNRRSSSVPASGPLVGVHTFFVEFTGASDAAIAAATEIIDEDAEDVDVEERSPAIDVPESDAVQSVTAELRARGVPVGSLAMSCEAHGEADGSTLALTIAVTCGEARSGGKARGNAAVCNRKLEGSFTITVPRSLATTAWTPTAAPVRASAVTGGMIALLWPLRMFVYLGLGWLALGALARWQDRSRSKRD